MCILEPNHGIPTNERRALTAELRQSYFALIRQKGRIVWLQTRLTAFPVAQFRIDVKRIPGLRLPQLLLAYVDHHTQEAVLSTPNSSTEVITMKKELAVFTIDHANFHEVANVAADMQVNAQMYFPKDHSPNGATIAELYDLDHWVSTAHDRDQLIAELAASPRRLPTGMHSYNMSDAQVEQLRKNGVFAARRLSRGLIEAILGGDAQSSAAAA